MNRQPFEVPPKCWSARLSPWWIKVWRPFRRRKQRLEQRLVHIEIEGMENLADPAHQGHGVLITPNHPGHADAYVLYEVADQLKRPFYFMTAWQVFGMSNALRRLILQHHGCFSVDREGTDLRAFRKAVEILQGEPHPLVIFPEGEVYHINERLTPFREGPATIAHSAAKRAERPVVCVPCAIKYQYLEDPMPQLLSVMHELESQIFWRPRPELPLPERIYRFAEGMLAVKEVEIFGASKSGMLPERLQSLIHEVLSRLQARHGGSREAIVPERVKALRQTVIGKLNEMPADDPARKPLYQDLDDIFFAVQLFSYPGDYVHEKPSIERMAETIDKFEEDVLGAATASIRGARRARVCFGEPIPVPKERARRTAAADLTTLLESRVQQLLDGSRAVT
jgi:hypothetical protein